MPRVLSEVLRRKRKQRQVVRTESVVVVRGRICVRCNNWTPLELLKKNKGSKFGRMRWCLDCSKKYHENYPHYPNHYNKHHFGSNKSKVLKRDKYKCVKCGMTEVEHKKKWNRGITVDHIDGKGRNTKVKNNRMSNLQTLCLCCHGKKDNPSIIPL